MTAARRSPPRPVIGRLDYAGLPLSSTRSHIEPLRCECDQVSFKTTRCTDVKGKIWRIETCTSIQIIRGLRRTGTGARY